MLVLAHLGSEAAASRLTELEPAEVQQGTELFEMQTVLLAETVHWNSPAEAKLGTAGVPETASVGSELVKDTASAHSSEWLVYKRWDP